MLLRGRPYYGMHVKTRVLLFRGRSWTTLFEIGVKLLFFLNSRVLAARAARRSFRCRGRRSFSRDYFGKKASKALLQYRLLGDARN
jgi:hypothetical protein